MRMTFNKFALGAIAALIALPVVQSQSAANLFNQPTSQAIPELLEEGGRLLSKSLSMAALADEMPEPPIDFSKLVIVNDTEYVVTHDTSVSTDVLSNQVIRKIGYGNVSEVSVVRTDTGTYTTDGLISPHILYPGITVEQVPNPSNSQLGMIWNSDAGWIPLALTPQNSSIVFGATAGGGNYHSNADSTCIAGDGYISCS